MGAEELPEEGLHFRRHVNTTDLSWDLSRSPKRVKVGDAGSAGGYMRLQFCDGSGLQRAVQVIGQELFDELFAGQHVLPCPRSTRPDEDTVPPPSARRGTLALVSRLPPGSRSAL